jgi:phosphomannomutase/phosphoglucomutase
VVKHFEAAKKGEESRPQRREEKRQGSRSAISSPSTACASPSRTVAGVRASSNKPELVVVVESPVSEQRMRDMFEVMDKVLPPAQNWRIPSEDLTYRNQAGSI